MGSLLLFAQFRTVSLAEQKHTCNRMKCCTSQRAIALLTGLHISYSWQMSRENEWRWETQKNMVSGFLLLFILVVEGEVNNYAHRTEVSMR